MRFLGKNNKKIMTQHSFMSFFKKEIYPLLQASKFRNLNGNL